MNGWLRLLAGLTCAALLLGGEDFWIKKPYTDWSEKDASKLLKNSPWAHDVSISLGSPAMGGGGGSGRRRSGGGGGNGMGDPVGASGGGASADMGSNVGAGRAGGGTMEDTQLTTPSVVLGVRWQSALPVRQALVVSKFGPEKADSEQAKNFLNQTVTNYVVGIIGVPPAFARGSGEGLPELAKLVSLVRKDKEPIVAEKAQASQQPKGVDIYFLFPKADAITLDDKEVEFVAKLGRIEIRRKFKLKEMVVGEKLEL